MHSRRFVCPFLFLALWLAPSLLTAAPSITTQPANANVTAGQSASFTVAATASSGTLTYQWRRNGFPMTGATNATYTIASVSRTAGDYYDCVVHDGLGDTVTSIVRLTVAPTTYPTNITRDSAWDAMTESIGGAGNMVVPIPAGASVAPGGCYIGGTFTTVNGTPMTMLMRLTSAGAVDPTFTPPVLDNTVSALALQPDGKLLIGGGFLRVNGTLGRSFLTRLTPTGAVDPAFNATLNFSVNVVTLQPDGQILVGGFFTNVNGTAINRIARLDANGSLDAGFAVGTGCNDGVNALLVQADGKLLVGGAFTTYNGTTVNRFMRLLANGALDTTLATGTGPDGAVNALALQAKDNAILLGGAFANYNGTPAVRLARVSGTGALDTTYNTNLNGGFNNTVNTIALQGDDATTIGAALVGGTFTSVGGTSSRSNFWRITATGAPDTVTPPTPSSGVNRLAVQADGRVVLAGGFGNVGGSANPRHLFARLNGNLTLDTSALVFARNANNTVATVLPQPDGKVIVTGNFAFVRGAPVPAHVARFNSNGTLDSTFNVNGTVRNVYLVNPGSGYTSAPAVAFSAPPAGGTTATGTATVVGGFVTSLSVTNAGSGYTTPPTITFTGGGGSGAAAMANVGGAGASSSVMAAALLPDGRLAIGGNFTSYNNAARNRIAVLKADGTLDTTFNSGGIVNGLVLGNGGSGYTSTPTVTFSGGGGSGAAATAVVSGGAVTGFVLTNQGNGYTSAPTIALSGGGGTGATATATIGATGVNGTVNTLAVLPPLTVGNTPRLFLGGSFTAINGTTLTRVGIMTLSGALDLNFNASGAGADNTVLTSTVQPDGKIVIGGQFANYGGAAHSEIARLTQTGAVDSAFPSSGTSFQSSRQVNGLAVLFTPAANAGQIVAAGSFTSYNGTATNYVARLLATGLRDSTFSATSGGNSQNGLLPQEDGALLVRGGNLNAGTTGGATGLMRLAASNGARDNSLLAAGFSATSAGWSPLVMLDDGGIITANNGTGLAASTPGAAPLITTQPSNQTASVGGSATFSVTASSIAPVSYQWLFNGVEIDGATNSSYAVTNAQLANVGNYSVIVSSEIGAVTSTAATLGGTNPPPTITQEPQNTAATVGTAASLTVTATGTGPLGYQWRRSGVPITGATSATYALASPSRTDADYYDVVVNDGLSTRVSQAARLTVAPSSYPQAQRLDPAFAPLFEASGSQNAINKIVLAPGNKFIAAGEFRTVSTGTTVVQSRIARFNADGSLDATFAPTAFGISPLLTVGVQTVGANAGKVIMAGPISVVLDGTDTRRLVRLSPTGALDPADQFNSGSGVTGGQINAVVVQPDDKVIAVGSFSFVNDLGRNRIVRFNADGTLDTTFFADVSSTINAVALQPDGKILIAGIFTNVNGQARSRVARLNVDGTLDTTFDPGTGPDNSANAIAVTTDGSNKIVIGGQFLAYNGNAVTRLARLNPDGSFDAGLAAVNNTVRDIACFADGSMLVAGTFSTVNGSSTFTSGSTTISVRDLVRLTSAGAIDATFNVGTGTSSTAGLNSTVITLAANATDVLAGGTFSSINGSAHATIARFNLGTGALDADVNPTLFAHATPSVVAAVPGGQLLVGGNFVRINGTPRFNLARINAATGALDPTYNAGAVSTASIQGTVNALVVRGDGKAVIAGSFTAIGGTTVNRIARLNSADGSLDPSFATGTGLSNTPTLLLQQPDGKLIVGGGNTSFTYNGVARNGLVRLHPDGSLDAAFAPPAFSGSVNAAALQPDGKIVVVGSIATIGGTTVNNVARLNAADGSLDSSFDVGAGPATTGLSAPSAVAVQPNGGILIGGDFTSVDGVARIRIARLTSTGGVDAFNPSDGGPTGTVTGIAVQEDGRILVRGSFSSVTNSGFPNSYNVLRYLANGTRDTSLAVAALGTVTGFVVLDNGSLVTIGNAFSYWDDIRRSIARYNAGQAINITAQPQSVAVNAGQPVSFSVAATGSPAPTYQWLRNGEAIFGATNATLSMAAADPFNHGAAYSVQVSNLFGTVTSGAAKLTVNFAPMLWSMAPNQSVDPSGTITLTGFADGYPQPISYQWKKDGVAIVGATDATYVIRSAQPGDAGTYTVVATNSVGSSVSAQNRGLVGSWLFTNAFAAHSTGVLTLLDDGRFLLAEDGDSVADPSGQDGMERGSFTWNQATGAFSVSILNQTNGGWGLSALGAGATLSVSGDTLTLTNGATTTTMTRVLPSAANPLVGAWFLDDPGTVVTFLADGRYFIAEDGDAEEDKSGHAGMERGTFSWDAASGAMTITVVTDTNGNWGFSDATNGTGHVRVSGDVIIFSDAKDTTAAFRVKPAETVLSVTAKPVIATAPAAASVQPGGSTTLSVTAGGTGPFTYQWRKNGVAITGATSSTLALANLAAGDFGRYDVVVTNAAGSTTSPTATVIAESAMLDEAFRPPHYASLNGGSLMTVLSDGSIIQGNTSNNASLVRQRSAPVVRYLPDGTRDLAFDINFPIDLGNPSAFAATTEGKFYASSMARLYSGAAERSRFARYLNDGTSDPTFTPFDYERPSSGTGEIRHALPLADGKVLVSGFFRDLNGTGRAGIARLNGNGTLDASFAVTAMTTSANSSGVWARPALDPSGKILVAGDFASFNGVALAGVARLNADGTSDPAFQPFGFTRNAPIRGIVVQANGSVVLGGRFTVGGVTNIPFIRLKPSGALDTTFSLERADPIQGTTFNVRNMIALPSDRFAVVGATMLVCNADGTRDLSFAPPVLANNSSTAAAEAFSLARLSDGSFVLAGLFDEVNGFERPNLVRIDPTGAVLPFTGEMLGAQLMPFSFMRTDSGHTIGASGLTSPGAPANYIDLGIDGSPATTPFSATLSGLPTVNWLTTAPDGKIFALGEDSAGAIVFRRVLADGAVDPALTVTTPVASFAPDRAVVQADGKTLLMNRRPTDQAVANNATMFQRINVDGSVDATYTPVLENAATPVRGTPLPGETVGPLQTITELNVEVLLIDASNRAYVRYAANGGLVRLARLNPDGSRDTSFAVITAPTLATTGTATVTDPLRPNAAASAVTVLNGSRREFRTVIVQPSGKIVIGGQFSTLNINGTATPAPGIARLNADGTFDASFAVGGGLQWTPAVTATNMPAVEAMVQQADGRLLVAGTFDAYDGASAPGLVRLNADGSRDATFVPPVTLIRSRTIFAEMAMQRDGSVYLQGTYAVPGERFARGLVRLFTGGPSIPVQPIDVIVNQGGSATFSVTASGPTPLSYQWKKGTTEISGATNSTYTIASVQPSDAGSYSVVITSPSGVATSTSATLTVNYAPVITTPPANQTAADGATATFSVVANAVPAPTYQWSRNGAPISGATSASYTTPALVLATNNGDTYSVVVTNSLGSTPSASATLTVTPVAPQAAAIGASFGSALPAGGGGNLLTAKVTAGTAPLSYQWRLNGADISGATASTYSIRNAQPAHAGNYSVVISNAVGSATSGNFPQSVVAELGWQPRSPVWSAASFSGALFANGQFVMGGTRGAISTSSDGTTWTSHNAPTASNLFSFAFGNGTYVAFGSGSVVFSSTDASTWTPGDSGIPNDAATINAGGVAFGNGKFVAVYSRGATSISADGLTWTAGTVGATDANGVGAPAFLDGKFYVAGTGVLYVSTDGQTWTTTTLPTTNSMNHVAFGAGRFVAVGASGTVLTSTDATNWTPTTSGTTQTLRNVVFANNQFVASSMSGEIFSSPDGLAWTKRATSSFGGGFGAAVFGNGLYLLPGGGANGGMYTSADGVTWTSGPVSITANNLKAAATNDTGTVVIVGQGGPIFSTTDGGVTFSKGTFGGTVVTTGNYTDTAFGNGVFAAVGNSGLISTSADGAAWTNRTSGTTSLLRGVRYGNGQFVAVGVNGTIVTSDDGAAWSSRTSGVTSTLANTAFGAGLHVVVGASGTILTSPDRVAWTARTSGTTAHLNDVVFASGQFVAVGIGVALTSPDGITWTDRTFSDDTLTSVNYLAGVYLATATSANGAANTTYWTSSDGIAWTARFTGAQSPLANTVATATQIFAVGNAGTVMTAGAPILSTPQSQLVAPGATVTFVSHASATPVAPAYQWQKKPAGGSFSDISGATSNTLTVANVSLSDLGDYRLVATNSFGATTSAAATLSALIAPTITTQPVAAQTVVVPQSASFSVVATGSPAPTYQWKKDGAAILNATNATFTIATTSGPDAGVYTVVVSNAAGSITSTDSVLTVNEAAAITTQPLSQTIVAGQPVTFAVVATGIPSPSYQWKRDGAPISGATDASYAIPAVVAADNGAVFTVTVANAVNSLTSNPATLTVHFAPTATITPANPVVLKDQPVTFTVATAGNPAPALQWSRNGTAIASATNATLTIASAQPSDEGTYSVSVTNPIGTATDSTTLTVNFAPAITAQPADVVANLGGSATFSVTAIGKPMPTYQWRKNGTGVPGATNASLALTNLGGTDAGSYDVVVTNSVSSVTSSTATLTLNAGIASFSPSSANVGDTVTINGVGLTGATTVKFNGTAAASFTVVSDTQITAVVPTYATSGAITITTAGGATLTSASPLTILAGPRIANGSIRATVGTGENALLSSFTIEGTTPKSLLIRAVGPGLVPFGITGALADPQLAIHDGTGAVVASNDNWGGSTAIANASSAVGAFPLTATSKDSALLVSLAPGTYTARVTGAGATTGEVLLELYETASTGRAAYLSTRARSTSSITSGFVLGGTGTSGSKTVLIRAIGAGLGTSGALANPTLTVLSGTTTIATNDNWGSNSNLSDLATATAAVGAMPLATNDAALLLTLPAGSYTVQAAGGTGLVMTEIFLVDGYRDAAFAPALLAPLQNQTLVAGSSVTFAAPFVGKPTSVGFQWKKNGNAISGATTESFTIANANATDAGDYSVTMDNTAGTTTTVAATLGVNTPPAITTQPLAQTVIVGQNATFTVAATGFPEPTYQWRRNGLNITGGTNASLTLASVAFDSGGSFDVVVTNSVGTVTSSSALLIVNPLAPNITSPLSATGVLGRTFSYQINANTTQATYGASGLPGGLVIDTATGAISGVPTATGSFSVTLTAQNVSGSNAQTLALAIQPPPPIINSAASSSGRVGAAFTFTIQAVNTPSSFGATGLPGGLTLNTTSGEISGTPTQAGTFTISLSATNATGTTTSQFVLTIEPPLNAPVYSGTTLLSGVQNSAFSFTPVFNTSGLTTTYAATGLPAGVTIDANTGAIGGTPTATGSFNVDVTATSSGGATTVAFTFTVNPPPSAPTISSASLASGTVGSAFSFTLTAGGTPTSFAAAGLPALGLSLNASTGVISGTPAAPGTLTLQVSAANNVGTGAQAALVITINPSPNAPIIDSGSALSGRVGDAFSSTLHASHSPTSFVVSSGPLPAGLSLNASTGEISGTPAQVGSFAVWFAASNAFGAGYALQVNFTIAPALTTPVVNSNATAAGQVGQPFTYQITATNSPTSFAATGLPVGLSLNASTGVISGLPSEATTTALAIALTASNADGTSTPKTLLLTIAPAPATPVITSALSASAQVGTAFSYQTTASDNATSFVALGLPAGLSLNSTSGAISGTPTTSGPFNVVLRAANAAGLGAPSTLVVNVAPAPSAPAITSPAAASGKVGNSFTYTITTSATATSYGLTGTLPLGLSLNTSTGVISGSPAASGVFTVQLTATGTGGTSLPQALVLNIAPADNAPVITSPIYASATVGQSFTYQITAASSPSFPTAPFPAPFTLDAISLPAGLGVNPSTGAIQGQPTTAGVFAATLVGTNAAGTGPYRDLTIFVAPAPTAPTVTSSPYAAGQVGTGFSYTITGTNSPTSFDVLGAPAWMTINNATGALAGNPTTPGTFTVQLIASNAAGSSNSLALTLTLAPSANAPVVTSTRTATGTVSASFAYQITAAVPSGAPPVTSYVATGLPAGLSLNAASGAIGGTPTQSGQFEVTLIARNSAGDSQPVTLILTINPSLQFNL